VCGLFEDTDPDWEQLVKKALKSWPQSLKMGQNPLTQLNIVQKQRHKKGYGDDSLGAAQALRDILRLGIEALGVPGQPAPSGESDTTWFEPEWRFYSILTLRYIRRLSRGETQQRIGLAEGGQYYQDQRQAIALLAAVLREWEGDPLDEVSQIALAYPSGAVKLSDSFYIKRQCDKDISYEIAHPCVTITITGPRQVGKTSLLVRAVQTAVSTQDARIVYLDVQGMSQANLSDQTKFFQLIAYLIADELNIASDAVEKTWSGHLSDGRKLTRFMDHIVLANDARPLMLALDEVDRLLLTGYQADFFGLLRSWHNMRSRSRHWENFSLIMAISTEPYLLIDDIQQSPFNVGLVLYLDDFNEAQVEELYGRYHSPVPPEEIPNLYRLLNGHPYLTRVAFYTMVKDHLTMPELVATAVSETGPFASHLRFQRQLITAAPELRAALKQVLKENRCSDEIARYRLTKAGLIKQSGSAVICRCDLYRDYFSQTL
jgi:hypothetical protein